MYWSLDEEGTLCVSGSGKMPNYACGTNPLPPWHEIRSMIRQVEIGYGITELGIRAFEDCRNLETVYLPDSVRRIHSGCFYGCTKLEDICTAEETAYRFIYDDTEESEKAGWMAKQRVVFGINSFYAVPWALHRWGLYYISEGRLMAGFSQEQSIVIPEGVETIGKFAFSGMPVREVKFPESLCRIESFAFESTGICELYFPENLRYAGYGAFAGSALKKAVFPVSYCRDMELDPGVFAGTAVHLPVRWKRNMPSIYEIAACSCGLTGFSRLFLREKKATASKGVIGIPLLHTGRAVFSRIRRGGVLICIRWDEELKKVSEVKSFRWNREYELAEVYIMHPCYGEDENTERVSLRSDSCTYLDEDDIICSFQDAVDQEQIQSGKLRVSSHAEEEWFRSSDRGNFGGSLEFEILEHWLKQHPA
ncbi:MAG: leucine-rich repeat domain-containing protein [Lachnospiraceae bacterium]|nr:leucine-rich repeat domain-containing protein [Lachnospiraceae bacterium]